MQKRSFGGKLATIIMTIVALIIILFLYNTYKENYFNGFRKGEYILNLTEFKRDSKIKYSTEDSFRIETQEKYNDAMFYKEVSVTPNTAYKVSAMVKTQDVKTGKEVSIGGARNMHN